MSEIKVNSVVNSTGDNDSGLDLSTNDVVAVKTANTEKMRIDANGNVGIGTSSPTDTASFGKALDVSSSTGGAVYVRDAGGSKTGHFGQFNEQTSIVSRQDDGNIGFYTGASPSENMRVTQNGNLAIGTTTEFARLHVTAQGNVTTPGLFEDTTTGSSSVTAVVLKRNGSNVGAINTTNTSTAYVTSSDHRLKENVEDMTGAIDRVKQLLPKRFNFIADADTTVDGFLAHEAQSVVAEAVTGTYNEVDDDGEAVMQGIDQAKLVPLLTGALKEAIAKIEALETRVTALEG